MSAGERESGLGPFILAGGGTGGHVFPLLAVAAELRRRGHQTQFVGTRAGIESRLVPARGFAMEYIEIGGLQQVGLRRTLRTLWQLPAGAVHVMRRMRLWRAAAVFSLGGYVAGPTVIAAALSGVPAVAMEPNAVPGLTNRRMGRYMARTLLAFPETARYFPAGRSEVTGLPVRDEFFAIVPRQRGERLCVLVTGGSRGSRTLNEAARQSWKLLREAGAPVAMTVQTGADRHEELQAEFAASGLDGAVVPFIEDMPAAFAAADLVICRSGAGAVSELAAAGKPSVLVPFPFAADQHQLRNAEALALAGAALLVKDADMSGESLVRIVRELAGAGGRLERMGEAARSLARRGAAGRAADILEELALQNCR